jgi:hypothetical protein
MWYYLKLWFAMHLVANREEWLALDLAAAAMLGAPQGLTLSALAHCGAARGRWWGKVARIAIDAWWCWLFMEHDHCRKSYEKRRLVGSNSRLVA